ncbi:hypothetical protein BDY19DRAFT_125391 [Irpex rosettiformis]|uniref:Uncharacterized protein n=1 Tax=Irpex rosettiformis TaxID=378272 RepID=A0ACB8U445_9APHY|nr:hypothetical protein BDY19DRAFT_125391 [Irpex rosettiformis]
MNDDLDFGSSVWGTSERLAISVPAASFSEPSPAPSSSRSGFDDFDDFGTPAETVLASGDEGDDDFGDFGDFGEVAEVQDGSVFEPEPFEESIPTPRALGDWTPLRLDPFPSKQELRRQIDNILDPLWSGDDPSHFTDDPIRQVEGLNQTLVTPASRQLYDVLLPATQPTFRPVNWTRSRIRRQHLIELGIPVNLDEVLPRAVTKLPTLEIHTRPTSAPPLPRSATPRPTPAVAAAAVAASQAGTPRSGTPQPGVRNTALATAQLRLGPKPEIDEQKITSLLNIDTDNLLLLPASRLERYLEDFRLQTANTSALLTYLLQTRDALQQDSETYNKLIGELVGEAQKIKTGRRAVSRQSTR